ncbi:MAG: hypothetical protein ACPIOQ_05995 [Promethearchaeia archaeon]
MTSHGPHPFLLKACEGKNWRMIAGKVPDLYGDPCEHCPGWGRAWDAKHRRPYWYHWAHGAPNLVPTVGWREPLFAAYCLYSLEDVGSLLRGMSLKIKRKKKSAATMLELTGMG